MDRNERFFMFLDIQKRIWRYNVHTNIDYGMKAVRFYCMGLTDFWQEPFLTTFVHSLTIWTKMLDTKIGLFYGQIHFPHIESVFQFFTNIFDYNSLFNFLSRKETRQYLYSMDICNYSICVDSKLRAFKRQGNYTELQKD